MNHRRNQKEACTVGRYGSAEYCRYELLCAGTECVNRVISTSYGRMTIVLKALQPWLELRSLFNVGLEAQAPSPKPQALSPEPCCPGD